MAKHKLPPGCNASGMMAQSKGILDAASSRPSPNHAQNKHHHFFLPPPGACVYACHNPQIKNL